MDIQPICVNGYDTYFTEIHEADRNYLLIAIPQNADKSISKICGTFVNGYLITEVHYKLIDETRFIIAVF